MPDGGLVSLSAPDEVHFCWCCPLRSPDKGALCFEGLLIEQARRVLLPRIFFLGPTVAFFSQEGRKFPPIPLVSPEPTFFFFSVTIARSSKPAPRPPFLSTPTRPAVTPSGRAETSDWSGASFSRLRCLAHIDL